MRKSETFDIDVFDSPVTYKIYAYYDEDFCGLEDSFMTADRSEMQEYVHERVSKGNCVKVVRDECTIEQEHYIMPDDYFEDFDGEFPYSDI